MDDSAGGDVGVGEDVSGYVEDSAAGGVEVDEDEDYYDDEDDYPDEDWDEEDYLDEDEEPVTNKDYYPQGRDTLPDRNKIAFKIARIGVPINNFVDISVIVNNVKKIKSVFYIGNYGDFIYTGWREWGGDSILYVEKLLNAPLCVQYIQDIPAFKMEDIYGDEDPDLKLWGISETMCDYIVEYVQGKLQETIAPELSNMHITRAEQYFDDLEEQQVVFNQTVVANKFRIQR